MYGGSWGDERIECVEVFVDGDKGVREFFKENRIGGDKWERRSVWQRRCRVNGVLFAKKLRRYWIVEALIPKKKRREEVLNREKACCDSRKFAVSYRRIELKEKEIEQISSNKFKTISESEFKSGSN